MDHPLVEPATKDFKVAIVGGGLCGLALAVGLLKAGINVEIYEAAVSCPIPLYAWNFYLIWL